MIIRAAGALISVMPQMPIWLMTNSWSKFSQGFDQLRAWMTHKLFTRMTGAYGFITSPPLPLVPEKAFTQAERIRRLNTRLEDQHSSVLCLAPESLDFPAGIPVFPPDGVGKFNRHMLEDLKRNLPAGVYDESGILLQNFGQTSDLDFK